jgi:hypothetical protein
MKKRYILGIIILIIILVLVFSPSTPSVQSYNGTAYSFNYPSNWKINWESNTTDENGTGITLKQTNGSGEADIVIFNASDTNFSSLNDYMNNFISLYSTAYTSNQVNSTLVSYPDYQLLNNTNINVNGLNGFDMLFRTSQTGLVYESPVYVEEVMLQKGNKFYEVRLDYAPNVTSPYAHNDFMTIVNSLKIK